MINEDVYKLKDFSLEDAVWWLVHSNMLQESFESILVDNNLITINDFVLKEVDKMNAEILVNLNKKRDFYNKFSNLKINDKLSEYIYNESLEGDYNNKVIINITCKEKISDEEKQDMIDIIRKVMVFK